MVEVSHFLFLLCLTFLLTLSAVKSLHLKLIHPDSIHSPFYLGNLTNVEKLQRLNNYSIATAQYYKTMFSQSDYNKEQIHPEVTHDSFHYVVELTVGRHRQTRRRKSYKFVMDTGSNLMWLQCRPCQNSWKQQNRIFNEQNSESFQHIPCNHPLCDLTQPGWQCVQNYCQYTYQYVMSKATIGVLASDTIGFSRNPNPSEIINPVVFGCTYHIQGNFAMPDDADGVIGFNPSPLSLLSQIQHNVGGHQFAYCLSHHTSSPLKLGHDAFLQGPNVKTIRMSWFHGSMHVYLPLRDVSIGNRRINFARGTFDPRLVGNSIQGGFIIDSGSVVTYITSGGPYARIMGAFMDYFNHHHGLEHAGQNMGFELCYHNRGFNDFPNMVLHFEGQDFIVQPENLMLLVADNTFCVAIRHIEGATLFGAYQQKDHWISFDYTRQRLSYVPADCSHHT